MIKVSLDESALATLNRLSASLGTWNSIMYDKTANEVAELAKETMKPLMHVRPVITGKAEDALRHEITTSANGFEINFFSNFYENFVDEGSPFTRLFAYNYGLWGFPISTGEGKKMHVGSISGVGLGNSPYASQLPTHFSQKTVDSLEQNKAEDIMFKNLTQWMAGVGV